MNAVQAKKGKSGGFTLLEMLIVIGLLAALVGLILPSLSGNRTKALETACDYNNSGTARTLSQYVSLYGKFPDQLHTIKLTNDTGKAVADLMKVPDASLVNFTNATVVQLTTNQANSLANAGIYNVVYNDYDVVPVAEGVNIITAVGGAWLHDDLETPATFGGRSIAQVLNDEGVLAVFAIAPCVDWESGYTGTNADSSSFATAVADVKLKVDLAGKCPVPTDDSEFRYYLAFVKVYNDGTAAEFIGTACPECGILNP